MTIRFEALRFLRGSQLILEIPSLAIPAGRTTALLGPNGSGKTTLLRLISGLEPAASGAIFVDDRQVNPAAEVPTDLVAFAFQEAVFLRTTVRANLDLALRLRGLLPAARQERIAEVAGELGIGGYLDRRAGSLSHGEAQRVNLARTLALRAPVTLLDEPLTGLDASVRRRLLDQLPGLLERFTRTAVVVTHDREEALRLARSLVILDRGRVQASGDSGDLLHAPPNLRAARVLGFTVLPQGDRLLAVPPDGLLVERGEPELSLAVERLIDMGGHREVVGLIAGQRVRARLSPGEPPPAAGEQVPVTARRSVIFPAADPAE